jgi:aspartate/methionine/tyrosine aminotransferase
MHPLANELNATLQCDYPLALALFSARGRRIYFPRTGILGQTSEAVDTEINATIGIALEDDGVPMHHAFFDAFLKTSPKETYPYAPSYGVERFRERWKQHVLSSNPSYKGEISLPVVTCGLTHALSTALSLFVDPGESVITTDMHWDNCDLIITEYLGACTETFRMFAGGGLDLEAFASALRKEKPGKRIILLNFPNNPTGYSPTSAEARHLAEIIIAEAERGSDIAVMLDDAYFGFGHREDVYTESLVSLLGAAHERILVAKIDGPTKEDCTWGQRIGCLSFAGKGMALGAAKALEAKAAGIVRATCSSAPRVFQELLVRLYQDPGYGASHAQMVATIRKRYEKAKDILRNPAFSPYFRALPSNAGYFLCIELAEGIDGNAVRERLIAEYDTGVIAFGRLLRIAYSCIAEEKIPELFERIMKACRDLDSAR